jgi:cysteine-rich repeat protein
MIPQAGLAALSLLMALTVGDGKLRPGEQQGLTGLCGDGVLDPGEACDDGNTAPGDGCGADCGLEAGHSCYGQPSLCNAGCGDGALGEGEQCDDGNSTGGDGCGVHCAIEPGHGCTGVPSVCTVACGDGIQDTSEACDDGNTGEGDGCSAACTLEAGFSCQRAPVSSFFTRRGVTDCTPVSSFADPQLPASAAQATLSTPGRYRIQYVSGAISFSSGGNWRPGIIGVNFTSETGPGAFSIGINPPAGGQPSRELAMSLGFGLKRDFDAASGQVLVASVDTGCFNNGNTAITYRVDALTICQREPFISLLPGAGGLQAFAGGAAPGMTVEVYLDGDATPVCTAVANPSGEWTCTVPVLAEGPHSAVATVTVLSATAASAPVTFVWDTVAPMAPVLIIPTQGAVVSATPEFRGVAEPGSQVTVAEDSLILCTTTAAASGTWNCTPPQPVAAGPHTVLATATDAAANSSSPSAWRAFTVDAEAPAAPALLEPRPQEALAAPTPSFRGMAEPCSTIHVYIDGGTVPICTAEAAVDGSWSCTVSSPLAEGAHTLTATATDTLGNTGPGTLSTSFTVDTQAPDTSITRGPPALAIIGSAEFEFSSNEAGVSYECGLDTESFTPCLATYSLAPGAHTLRVRAVDAAGNADPSPAEYPWTVKLPHLAGGGCSAVPLPAAWLALLGLAALRPRSRR